MRWRTTCMLAVAALGLAACGSGEAAAPSAPPSTVPNVGDLPADRTPTSATAAEPAPTDRTGPTGSTAPTVPPASGAGPGGTEPGRDVPADTGGEVADRTAGSVPEFGPIGRAAAGNRVLVVGDSILEAVGTAYGGELCNRLVPRGWEVRMDARNGRSIDAAAAVLDRWGPDWDVVVVGFGSNYEGDAMAFEQHLRRVFQRLRPRPVVVLTVTEFRDDRAEVNYVIRDLSRRYANVRVLEWSETTRADEDLLGGDGLHLNEEGKAVLGALLASTLGRAPAGATGACLDGADATDVTSATDAPDGDAGTD